MDRPKVGSIATDAFFDNFSFCALFGRLRIPGAPREIMDPRSLREFSADELQFGIEDIREEVEQIRALVLAEFLRGSSISNEALQGLPEPETRVYKGVTYVKGADGQWHLQTNRPRVTAEPVPAAAQAPAAPVEETPAIESEDAPVISYR